MRTHGALETVSGETEEPPNIKTVSPSPSPKKLNKAAVTRIPAHAAGDKVVGISEARRESFPVGKQARAFQKAYFPGVSPGDWNDWRWQLRSRIKSLGELERMFTLSEDERDAIRRHQGSLPVGITPYYASLLDRTNPDDGLRRTHIPVPPGPIPVMLDLLPDEGAAFQALFGPQYMTGWEMALDTFRRSPGLDRAQMEVVSSRTSIHNECFY